MSYDDYLDDRDAYLADHAQLLGYELERLPPPLEECPHHGTYTPLSLIDADCPTCEEANAKAWEERRAGRHVWVPTD